MWSDARSNRRGSSPRTSGIAGCSGAASAAASRNGSHRTPTAKRPTAAAPKEQMNALPGNTACRRWD